MVPAFVILVICFAVAIYQWKLKSKGREKFLSGFPGPRKFPIIGNCWFLANAEDRLSNMLRLQRMYGNRVHLTGGSLGGLLLFHPDDVEKILTSREINKSLVYDLIFTDWLRSSLLFAKGEDYFKKRKFVLPTLDVQRVDNFEKNFNENSNTLVNILRVNESKGKATEIQELLRLCTLDISWQYLGGIQMKSLENHDNEYASAVHSQTELVTHRAASPWLWPNILWEMSPTGRIEKKTRKILHSLIGKIVEDRKSVLTNNFPTENIQKDQPQEKVKLKLLDLFVTKQQECDLTNEYIRNETGNVLLAAHHTVASALTFAIYLLAAHPDQQAELHQELDKVLGADRERSIQLSDLRQLKFLECCFKETLRLFPPVPILLRSVDKDIQLDEDLTIPKGVEIGLVPWVTHRLPEYFPDPEKYKPSRFSTEDSAGRHPYSYFPFSGGPRSCMGQKAGMMKAKTILANIFRNFTVKLEPGYEEILPVGEMIIFAKNGLKIQLQSR